MLIEENNSLKELQKDNHCPCLYLKEPCHERCTCVNPFSSSGCKNCCRYGSLEQKKEMAEKLNGYRLEFEKNNK